MAFPSIGQGLAVIVVFGVAMALLTLKAARNRTWSASLSGFLYAKRDVSTLPAAFSIAASWIWAPALFVSVQFLDETVASQCVLHSVALRMLRSLFQFERVTGAHQTCTVDSKMRLPEYPPRLRQQNWNRMHRYIHRQHDLMGFHGRKVAQESATPPKMRQSKICRADLIELQGNDSGLVVC